MTALLGRRSHLSEQLSREKNRLQNSPKIIQRMIRFVEKQIEGIDQLLRKLINENDLLRAQAQLLTSVKGVDEVTTWTLLAYLSEMTHLKRNRMVPWPDLLPITATVGRAMQNVRSKGGVPKS